jgi:hypothetical protein
VPSFFRAAVPASISPIGDDGASRAPTNHGAHTPKAALISDGSVQSPPVRTVDRPLPTGLFVHVPHDHSQSRRGDAEANGDPKINMPVSYSEKSVETDRSV